MAAGTRLLFLTLAALALLTLPRVLKVGMFFDGVTFSSFARNLAEGKGTFWAPHYTETVWPRYFDVPPLGFWLQSWVYRLFGDHVSLDPMWDLATGLLIVLLLVPMWTLAWRTEQAAVGAWWPVLMFVSFPMTAKTLTHNLMEHPMAVFVLASSVLALLGLSRREVRAQIGYGTASGLLLVAACLTKGPQAIFPLVLPVFAALFFPSAVRWRHALVSTVSMAGALVGGIAIIYVSSPGAREFFHAFTQGVLSQLQGGRGGGQASRWAFFGAGLLQLAVPVGIGALGALLCKTPVRIFKNRRFGFFLALACCGSLPLLISPKLYARYLFPSLPFFALALGALFESVALRVEQLVQDRRTWSRAVMGAAIGGGVVAVALMLVNAGEVRRAKEFHADLPLQGVDLDGRALVSVCPSALTADWRLVANMQRVYRASLTGRLGGRFLLVEKQGHCSIPPHCELLQATPPLKYLLYRCQPESGPAVENQRPHGEITLAEERSERYARVGPTTLFRLTPS
ncbi:MAG: ArnT family glycosyltransferase [Candidatus Methylomirabilia bacterium]